jgi:hypothetical protein
MSKWIEGGVQLGWLIDPDNRMVDVYGPGKEPESIVQPERLEGQRPAAGFVLKLETIWSGLYCHCPDSANRHVGNLLATEFPKSLLRNGHRHLVVIMLGG